MVIYFLLISIIIFLSTKGFAMSQTKYSDYKNASETIGKWLSRSTAQNDFLSAAPLSPHRSGDHFMITGAPAVQRASDYGFSVSHAPLSSQVVSAYGVMAGLIFYILNLP
jgi:hypothetical protein